MTKPYTHVLPYLVGMLVGWFLLNSKGPPTTKTTNRSGQMSIEKDGGAKMSLTGLAGVVATVVALGELFLPYKWNNSNLPSKLMASTYASLFRLGWSLVLAYVVLSCRHKRGPRCTMTTRTRLKTLPPPAASSKCCGQCTTDARSDNYDSRTDDRCFDTGLLAGGYCFCGSGGNYMNWLLSLDIFGHLSKLSFVAYLIHLPLMSVFIGQTRGLFAFSHTLVIHFAISYLVMTFVLSFILVHVIEYPFITFERHMFASFLTKRTKNKSTKQAVDGDLKTTPTARIHQNRYSGDTEASLSRPRLVLAQQAHDDLRVKNDLCSNVAFSLGANRGDCNNICANYEYHKEANMLDQTELSKTRFCERL